MGAPEPELADQTNLLPKKQLIVVFCALAGALWISFVDQNGIGVTLPTVGRDLHALDTISWAGTSALIANTVFQVLYGRLSDIFGRKVVLCWAMAMLAVGDILCGFATTSTQLYVFRGLAGLANGGITAMTMAIVSDIVTLEQRGLYQGILGAMVGLGNTAGPFLAAAFVQLATWRGLFYFIAPVVVIMAAISYLILPSKPPTGGFREKAKKIDFLGLFFSSTSLIFLMIPISGGGSYFDWNGPLVVGMLAVGGVAGVLFVVTEWKWARLPMMPLRLFRNPPVCAILVQNFLLGMVYYSDLYYLPIYYQNVRGWDPIRAASLTVPLVIGQMMASVFSGQYISRTKRYGEIIWAGYFLWALGAGLKCIFSRTTSPGVITACLLVEGVGCGNVFQPTLVAAQAHASKADRAVVISVRNFIRAFGGSCGLAISAAILSNVLQSKIPAATPGAIAAGIRKSAYNVPDLSALGPQLRSGVLDAYLAASRGVFVFMVPLMAACLALCVLVKDRGLQRRDEVRVAEGAGGVVVEVEVEVVVERSARASVKSEGGSGTSRASVASGVQTPVREKDVAATRSAVDSER